MSEYTYHIPNDDAVSHDDIHPEANLSGADLSEATLPGAPLSEADLHATDLSEANLLGADLSEANLRRTDLSGANLGGTNFMGANLYDADLSGSNLLDADFSEANLRSADFEESYLVNATLEAALLWDTSLSGALLSRATSFDPPGQRLERHVETENVRVSSGSVDFYDAVARANYEQRAAYSGNGLISRARKARIRERRARRQEAKADGTTWGTIEYFGSLLSRVTTGYGVQLLPVGLTMLGLFLGSTAIYSINGLSVEESLYYSVVTFTTSPPSDPNPGLMRWVAGIETFLGTTAIIFLGYVLGTRERV